MRSIHATVDFELADGVAWLRLSHKPVNSFSLAVRRDLLAVLDAAENDPAVVAIVLSGAGKGFSAGGDVKEFGTPAVLTTPRLTIDIHPRIEFCRKPVVAALHGYAIGGGMETAMACHARVACADTVVALPEVTVGVIPLSATQRLPRFIGMDRAAELILTGGRSIANACGQGLFDQIVPAGDLDALHRAAEKIAHRLAHNSSPHPSARHRVLDLEAALAALNAHRTADRLADPVRRAAIDALQAAIDAPDFDAGIVIANRITEDLLNRYPRKI